MPMLYHYCSPAAFLGIIETKELWAGSLRLMNDHMEMKWTIQAVEHYLDRVRKAGRLTSIESYTNALMVSELYASYDWQAVCFSRRQDDLSQWRGYADNASGYCIGFDLSHITTEQIVPGHENGKHLGMLDVIYDANEQSRILDAVFHDTNFNDTTHLHHSMKRALGFAPKFKNPSFVHESETRLLYWPDMSQGEIGLQYGGPYREVVHRMSALGPAMYYRIPFGRPNDLSALREVWIGPRNRASNRDVEILLRKNGFLSFKLERSSSSYR